jgi:hypothetical protein
MKRIVANAVKNSQQRPLFDPNASIRAEYRRRLPPLIKRLRHERPLRPIARKLGISHTALAYIRDNPERPVTRKTMLKIIRATAKRRRKHAPEALGWAMTSRCLVI